MTLEDYHYRGFQLKVSTIIKPFDVSDPRITEVGTRVPRHSTTLSLWGILKLNIHNS
jgi:hypothetical protein